MSTMLYKYFHLSINNVYYMWQKAHTVIAFLFRIKQVNQEMTLGREFLVLRQSKPMLEITVLD